MDESEFLDVKSLCKKDKLFVEDYKGNIMKIVDVEYFLKDGSFKYNLIPDWNTEVFNLEHEIEVLEKELNEKKEKLEHLKKLEEK